MMFAHHRCHDQVYGSSPFVVKYWDASRLPQMSVTAQTGYRGLGLSHFSIREDWIFEYIKSVIVET